MKKTPKSLRLQIGLFGRTNVGKSSFLNYVAGQDVAITSPVPGTTTDVVEKTMELLPLGPVVFLDTAGLDDTSALSGARLKKIAENISTARMSSSSSRSRRPGADTKKQIAAEAKSKKIPLIASSIRRPCRAF